MIIVPLAQTIEHLCHVADLRRAMMQRLSVPFVSRCSMVCVLLSTTPKSYSTVPLYLLLSYPVTALGRAQLRSLPLGRLRRYIDAYNIQIKNPIDKNDLVDAAMAVRVGRGISHHVK